MGKRTYEEYIKNDCHPVGYNEPCQSYFFGQTSVDLLLDRIDQLKQQLEDLKSKLREANRVKNKNKFLEEKNKEKREKNDQRLKEIMTSNSKLNLENAVLKQQLEEEKAENEILKEFADKLDNEFGKNVEPTLSEKADNIIALYRTNKKYCEIAGEKIKEFKQQLTEQEKEKVNGIFTDIIIEVTKDEFDLDRFCYLEEVSAKFGEKIQEKIKELRLL